MFFIQTPDWKDIPELLKEFDITFIESVISNYDYEDFKEILPMSMFENEYDGFIHDFVKEYNALWERSDHRDYTTITVITNEKITKSKDLINVEVEKRKDRGEMICSALEYFDYNAPQEIFDVDRR